MAGSPYSVATGDYTVDQLDGLGCARCGQPFQIGEASYPTGEAFDGAQLFAHVSCPKGGATR